MEIKEIIEKLKKLREDKGLTQQEFADKIGVSRTTVSKWETKTHGIPTDFLVKIIDFYGLSEKEQKSITDQGAMNEREKEISDSYEKIISFMKAALQASFNNEFYNSTFPIEVFMESFDDLTEEDKSEIEVELGAKLDKELYLKYCECVKEESYYNHSYTAFADLLKENPMAASLFHFGLLGNEFEAYFQRWRIEEKQEEFLKLTKELKIEMKNFKKVINSERLSARQEMFNNSINQDLVLHNFISNSWTKYF